MTSIPQASVDQLPADAAILDVREDDEWQAGHIDGAVHIPLTDVPQRLSELPEGDPIYVVCRSGGRSARATEFLNSSGIEAVNVDGGMRAWEASGKPMTSGSGAKPTVI
ncbi:rhodanese-like domain-containing protein [Cumulibacter manganitolerans]|uniref:rhodanese-like domain-containing protein n=1 Tax=Cumulibacter manganitolerans TaxID=1884992 RepID=UPI00129798CD|nr:rhodanese-like domain-containing protein [Cumulibacter manganitolerans]